MAVKRMPPGTPLPDDHPLMQCGAMLIFSGERSRAPKGEIQPTSGQPSPSESPEMLQVWDELFGRGARISPTSEVSPSSDKPAPPTSSTTAPPGESSSPG